MSTTTAINVDGAAARGLARGTCIPAECLVFVGAVDLNGQPPTRHAASAIIEWDNTPGKHAGTYGPAGTPTYFSGPRGFGDVAISMGDGRVVAIDTANGHYSRGVVGIQTIAQREAQVGGSLLGWSSELLGHELTWTVTPPPALPNTDARQVQILAAYLNSRFGPRYHSNAAANGVRGPIYWRMVQMAGKQDGLYGAGYIINGIPGARTRQVEAIYFARGV